MDTETNVVANVMNPQPARNSVIAVASWEDVATIILHRRMCVILNSYRITEFALNMDI